MANEKMTIRVFLENVIKAEISDEMTAFAKERITKIDEKNEKKKSATSAKKTENGEIKKTILASMEDGIEYKASEIGTIIGISTQKASQLLVQMEKDGILTATEKREKGKGKVKFYTLATVETDETETDETD